MRLSLYVVLAANCIALGAIATVLPAAPPRGLLSEPGTTDVRTVQQNWSDEEASWFYNVPQGSYLLRYEWFLNLEQADNESLFRDSAHMQALGYLARSADGNNRDGLPVGFVRDDKPLASGQAESYLGITCAACHTGHVNWQGTMLVIDGAPTNGNMEQFLRELVEALDATLKSAPKFERFATKVLGANVPPPQVAQLRAALNDALQARRAYNERNMPSTGATPYGHGRIDAFGAIMNEVAVRFAQVPGNYAPADAPVSYPMLWDTPQHDFVQWNASAENKRSTLTEKLVGTEFIGPLGRNTGEVLGVFGEIDASVEPSILELKHYPNSAKRKNLIDIEESLRKLWSPQWPDSFPPIDNDLRAQGAVLFENHCATCHEPIVRNDPGRTVVARPSDEGTDNTMANNFLTRTAKTGVLKGRRIEPLSTNSDRFGDVAPVGQMLRHLVQRAIIRSTDEILQEGQQHIAALFNEVQNAVDYQVSGQATDAASSRGNSLAGRFQFGGTSGVNKRVRDLSGRLLRLAEARLLQALEGERELKLNYKARPLNGVWASAPYLHNGSIPNLDELLKQPHERSQAVFKVGSREFDPVKVGFRTDIGVDFDPQLKGNRNFGHSYGHEDGSPFTELERRQLIEYLKSL